MKKKRWHLKSIKSRITLLLLVIIVFQTILLTGILIMGGAFKQAEENAYRAFSEKVENRKEYVEREMKNRWTNLGPYIASIKKQMMDSNKSSDLMFEAVMDDLIIMLRTTQVTGVYMVLDEGGIDKSRHPSIYLRDYDPLSNVYSYDDIYMVSGPSELANKYKIPLDQTWQYHLKLTDENKDFYMKPYLNAFQSSEASLLGYWSKPFKLSKDDLSVVTYSMPLSNAKGKLIGVIGIELTVNYLMDFFPTYDLQPKDSLGYMIAYRENLNQKIKPIVTIGALQARMIKLEEALELEVIDEDLTIYELKNHTGKEKIYASSHKLGIYQYNTPFNNEEWYVVGFMREDYLFSYVRRIERILELSLIFSLLLGILSGLFISKQMSNPIVKLAREVRESDKSKVLQFSPTGLLELDELSSTIELANKLMLDSASRLSKVIDMIGVPIGAFEMNSSTGTVFVTSQFYEITGTDPLLRKKYESKDKFAELLNFLKSHPEEGETDIYKMDLRDDKWIKITINEIDDLYIGVVLDVSDEILEKRAIKHERDRDALTGLLNRKGFQAKFEEWEKSQTRNDGSKTAALLMFDLDNLKIINDSYGHKWGDTYILSAVESLKTISDEDKMLLGRRSGDEFVLLLYNFENKDDIRKCIDVYFERLKDHLIDFPDKSKRSVAISAGVFWYDNTQLSYEEMLHYSDEALYNSKRYKKGSYSESDR